MITQERVLEVLKEVDVLLEGYFRLASGRHNNRYLQCAKVSRNTKYSEELCGALAEHFANDGVEVIIGPAIGAMQMAHEVSRALKCENFFAEREDGKMTLRRGFAVRPGRKVLIVEDVITTGGSVREVTELVRATGGDLVDVGSTVDRAGGKIDSGVPLRTMISLDVESWEPQDCLICKEGKPELVKPGSRKVQKARLKYTRAARNTCGIDPHSFQKGGVQSKMEHIPERSAGIHEGHRRQVQDRFLKDGIGGFASHEMLEMLLFSSTHRGDTNGLTHRLINRLGSLSGIFHAPYEELLGVRGVDRVSAFLMKLIPELCRVYYEDCHEEKICMFEVEQVAEILRRKYVGCRNEVVVLPLLDSQCRLLSCEVVNEGTVNTVPVYVCRMVELTVRYNASATIMSHNHPSGNPVPSRGDVESTTSVYHALQAVNVPLRDHIIFGDKDYVSLSYLGILKDIMEPFQPVVGFLSE